MQLTIRVKQSKVIFSNDLYQVIVCKTVSGHDKSSFIACGNIPKLTAKEEIVIVGEFKSSERFGEQFQVKSWKRPIPETSEQLITFFSSALFKGVGKKMAEKIVHLLGSNAIQRITKNGASCINVEGISNEMALKITETVQRTFLLNELFEKYGKYGISTESILRAYMFLGLKVSQLHDNPYLLAKYNLVHFSTADNIAKDFGILPHDNDRLDTAISLSIKELVIKQGHCYIDEADFIDKCLHVLNENAINDKDKVYVQEFISAMELSKEVFLKNGLVYPTYIYFAELDVAKHIHQLLLSANAYDIAKVKSAVTEFEKENKLQLAKEQISAVHELFANNVLILTGGPGVGKTFTVNAILSIYKKLFPSAQVALAAPIGRAAKKLAEVTGMAKHAFTLHRLLGIGVGGFDKPLFDDGLPLPQDFIVVDEYSMADIQLSSHLIKAVKKGSKLLIVGDPDQLPSVGAGSVLKDLLDAGVPQVRLKQIFRQAEQSTIVKNAHKINKGEQIDFTNKNDSYFIECNQSNISYLVAESVMRFIKKGYSLDDIMVVTPMKKGSGGVEALNYLIRERVNPANDTKREIDNFREGDKVMYTTNNKELDVYNGDTGVIKKINKRDKQIIVQIDSRSVVFEKDEWRSLQLAFARSIHKSQGEQSKIVMTVLLDEHDLMLTRNLFYTALTRSEEIHVLFGSKQAANKAVKTNRVRERRTTLSLRLKELNKYNHHFNQIKKEKDH